MKVAYTPPVPRWELELSGPMYRTAIGSTVVLWTEAHVTIDGFLTGLNARWVETREGGSLRSRDLGPIYNLCKHENASLHALEGAFLAARLAAWRLPPGIAKTVLFLRGAGFDARAGALDSGDPSPIADHISIWHRETLLVDELSRLSRVLAPVIKIDLAGLSGLGSGFDAKEECGRLDLFNITDTLIAWEKL